MLALQKMKSTERKKELQAELTRVQQQIREEQARRTRQTLDAERKVGQNSASSSVRTAWHPLIEAGITASAHHICASELWRRCTAGLAGAPVHCPAVPGCTFACKTAASLCSDMLQEGGKGC